MNLPEYNFQIEFEQRLEEINKYFEWVFLIDNLDSIDISSIDKLSIEDILNPLNLIHLLNKKNYVIDSDLNRILKANCYLILYNLVEGSLISGIDAIFLKINEYNPRLKYRDLSIELKEVFFKYKHKDWQIKKGKPKKEIVSDIEKG